ncbi:protein strawberry notch-like [Daphnia pulicaria]|uniref:protein strawberry notch-like n=1 Tax=Daphnia pulicaria TaxID=35523 RepID=UPI001EEC2160|nr:protein strawberry notch-like [Daphnia pulicaria]
MGCMELVGMEKQRGIFEVDVDQNLIKIYDQSVELCEEIFKSSHRSFTEAENRQTIDREAYRTLCLHFWAAHSDFSKYLCISAKIKDIALMAKQAVKDGKYSVGSGYFNLEAQNVLLEYRVDFAEFFRNMRKYGMGKKVSEISNRRGRVIQKDDGQIQYEHRFDANFPSKINISEKELFMQGHKNIVIVSEECSSGISLQADSHFNNQCTRVYSILELSSSVEVAIQQFCSTHRCNQVCNPEYILLYSNLAGEEKFASNVVRRLKSFVAVNLVFQRIVETFGTSELTLETKYAQRNASQRCKRAPRFYFSSCLGTQLWIKPNCPTPKCENCFVGAGLMAIDDTNTLKLQRKTSVKEFFEMMLGFPVRLQTSLYKFFTVTEATILTKANMLSKCDGINILELGAGQIVGRKKFHRLTSPYSTAAPLYCAIIELHTFEFDQGMSWKLAHDMSASLSGNSEGFYVSNLTRKGKGSVFLVVNNKQVRLCQDDDSYTAIWPNKRTGMEFSP